VKLAALVVFAACGGAIAPTARPIPPHTEVAIDTTPKARRRLVPPEAYIRTYLVWFGGLAPLDAQKRLKPRDLFDAWDDYLAALGLPDYKIDLPRAAQTNTLMVATFGRLAEALCARAAEHDLHGKTPPPIDQRLIFAFEPTAAPPTDDEFAARFDVLHRTFLGYPARLAPPGRVARFATLWRDVRARHEGAAKAPLTPDETAWAAVCTALARHPEAELY
jgi:hypothetical protein